MAPLPMCELKKSYPQKQEPPHLITQTSLLPLCLDGESLSSRTAKCSPRKEKIEETLDSVNSVTVCCATFQDVLFSQKKKRMSELNSL